MFLGLEGNSLVSRDDQQGCIDIARTCDHGLDELLVAGHIDKHDLFSVTWGVQKNESQFDRDAAALFFDQDVSIDSGKGFDKEGFAVVDMAGGANNDVLNFFHSTGRLILGRTIE